MYIMYVDESGDSGIENSPSDFFVISGIVLHELRWIEYLNRIIDFRKRIRDLYGLKLREEIHASSFFTRPKEFARIPKHERLAIVRNFTDEISKLEDFNVINIVVDKRNKDNDYDVFGSAWGALFQRFENTIRNHNFRGPKNPDDRGIIFPDNTDNKTLTALLRKLRRYNPIPNQPKYGAGYRDLRLRYLIEDPNYRDSRDSYFIQAADLTAFLLYQYINPNHYLRKKYAHNYFERLEPILCKHASSDNEWGIVYL